MDVAGQHFLAGAGLAGNQHGGITPGHPCSQLQQLLTGWLAGYRPLTRVSLDAPQRMTRYQIQQGARLERLDQVIGGALADGIDGTLDGAIGGHQQHWQLRVAGANQAQQLVTVHARHVDVADHQTERFFAQRGNGILGAFHGTELMPADHQRIGKGLAQRAVVFDQQNLGSHGLTPEYPVAPQ